ncbi:MAG TPA: hypothetical protein PLY00_04900 [Verrucomicrobiota bacterium]|nr:hypothetical protein [Verrucomicrobiota bacterium]HOA60035.1 hypothetical protein [Verrucomicrobiota bacterium]HOF47597.1 hypothetical protein [Verrucomicrobiota bacterium]HOG87056.1 hypothetical protein [Verrucomicrobiota bacterium]HOR70613.1 hypothetical protein [Verrucomicrobiota bacterium]
MWPSNPERSKGTPSRGRVRFIVGTEARECPFGPLPKGDSILEAVWSELDRLEREDAGGYTFLLIEDCPRASHLARWRSRQNRK